MTFRALHGNHIVSTPFQTIVEEDKHKKQKIVTHVSVHTLTFHETHYPPPPPPRNPWTIQQVIPGRATKSQTNSCSGRRQGNSKTICGRLGWVVVKILRYPRIEHPKHLPLSQAHFTAVAAQKSLPESVYTSQYLCEYRPLITALDTISIFCTLPFSVRIHAQIPH